ncbi:MAG: prepilin-type N-terminal cleavage/methylation domain-containing protein [Patescibacteria group bacterium]|nr:prepilin-type N-terminal cleavage/methylation domain-containing protein [Patescibacteria group bacterium]
MFFNNKGFTLIEILITITIIAILIIAVLIILNPLEYLKQVRDEQRLEDLTKLNKSILWFQADTQSKEFMGSSSVIYTSLPDNNSNCQSWNLPAPTSGWFYNCVSALNLQKIDGTGWLPINFKKMSFGQILNKLPIDPLNNSTAYYTYVYDPATNNFELNSILESNKMKQLLENDSGDNNLVYEIGSKLNLSPIGIGNSTSSQQINGIFKLIGSNSVSETGYDFEPSSDNGFIIVGEINPGPFGSSDILLVKLNNNFNIIWKKTLGTANSEYAAKIIKNNNKYFILVPGGGLGSYIVEIDENGNILQSKIIDSGGGLYCRGITKSSDNNYILACNANPGSGNEDIYIIKIDSNLNIIWAKSFGSSNNDYGFDVKEKPNGNYVIVGYQLTTISYLMLGEFDSNGNYIRSTSISIYNNPNYYNIGPNSLVVLNDGSIMIAGMISYSSNYYGFITKINSNMTSILWNKVINASSNEYINDLYQTSNNQYILIGRTRHNNSYYGILVMKIDTNGNILLAKKIDSGYSNSNTIGLKIKEINNNYYFVGKFYIGNIDLIFGKTDSNFNINSCSFIIDASTISNTSYILSAGSSFTSYTRTISTSTASFSFDSNINLTENIVCQN